MDIADRLGAAAGGGELARRITAVPMAKRKRSRRAIDRRSPPTAPKADYDSPWKEALDRYFERCLAFFFPQAHADIVDFGGSAPTDAGSVLKELAVQEWQGVKVYSAGTGSDSLVKVGGKAVEDTYMGQAANFSGPTATPLQSKLDAEARAALNEPLNILQMGCWDGVMVIKAGIERANSIDPKLVAKALPEAPALT